MAQHVSVDPLTREGMLEYAEACRKLALKLREQGDILSAELNERLAILYSQEPTE